MDHLEAESLRQSLRHQRAMARPRSRLDAHQRGDPVGREPLHQRLERYRIEDLLGVPTDVLGGERVAAALADAPAVVLAVLELPQLGRGRELGVVLVRDPGIGDERLQPP